VTDYCSVTDVKLVLHIEAEDTSQDSKLAESVTIGSTLIDNLLSAKTLTVPSIVPDLVKQAAANFAGWNYRKVLDPDGAEAFWVSANRLLDAYIDGLLKTNSEKSQAEIAKINAETEKLEAETALLQAETPLNEPYLGVA
jgi:hypothetical protein